MSTTFYFPSEGEVNIRPSADSTWDYSHRFPRRPLVTNKTYSPFVDEVIYEPVGSNPDGQNVIARQYISAPLIAQTISGTFKGHFLVNINNLCAKYSSQIVVKIVDSSGTFARALLYMGDLEENPLKISTVDAWSQSRQSRLFPRGATVPGRLRVGQAENGDRLVIEIGLRSLNTSFIEQSGTIRFGDSGNQNLPFDQTAIDLDKNPTVTFSDNLVFA